MSEIDVTQPRRVIQISTGMHGVVVAEGETDTLVHWGSTSLPGPPGEPPIEHKYSDWVPNSDLQPCPEKVFYGTEREKNRSVLYEPEAQ